MWWRAAAVCSAAMEALRLHDAVVFLATAGVVIPIVKRFSVNPVLGFLLMGIALGPHGLARFANEQTWLRHVLITDVAGVRALAELGVVFLLFMIGLELSLARLWAMRRLVFGLGTAQVVVTALVIGVVARAFGNSLEAAAVLGACLALSSTAVVMALLTEQGRFGTPVGSGSFAILLAQDLAVVPILFLTTALGSDVGGSMPVSFALAVGAALLAVLLILALGRVALRPLFGFVSRADSPELFMAATLLIIIATASLTEAAGLSAPLGAFLAGILLAETEFRHEIEVNIEPFKGLLLGLFFLSVGMGVDLTVVAQAPLLIAVSVAGLFAIKSTITAGLARAFGFRTAQAVETGLLLGQAGEFGFVVVALGATLGLLPAVTAQFMFIVVGATMLLTPLVARVARGAGEALARRAPVIGSDVDVADAIAGHVVIIGYGRTGRLLAELLDRQRIAHVALDLDPARVTGLRLEGAPVYVGDGSRTTFLEKVHLERAVALVVTMDDPVAALRVVVAARNLAVDTPILARAHDDAHAVELLAHGATHVVPEVLEAGLQLGQVLLTQVGLPADAAREVVALERAKSLHRLVAPVTAGLGRDVL